MKRHGRPRKKEERGEQRRRITYEELSKKKLVFLHFYIKFEVKTEPLVPGSRRAHFWQPHGYTSPEEKTRSQNSILK